MDAIVAYVEGIGWWSPGISDWSRATRVLRGEDAADTTAGRPNPGVLTPNERRRAPEPVAIACDVAAQACTMAGRDPATLACVFASSHGDLATTDALCAVLAQQPLETSPIKFHNSVHNAPAGYWTIATQCHAASTAIAAWRSSFAAGLLEAVVQANADETAVLFACYDIVAPGPLADVIDQDEPFGFALVLDSARSERSCATLHLRHEPLAAGEAHADADLARAIRPLFAAFARAQPASLRLPSGARSALAIEVTA